MNLASILAFQPRDLVGQWLKATRKCDITHYIIWKDKNGYELRTGCQKILDARLVIRPILGARRCETCQANLASRNHANAKKRHPR